MVTHPTDSTFKWSSSLHFDLLVISQGLFTCLSLRLVLIIGLNPTHSESPVPQAMIACMILALCPATILIVGSYICWKIRNFMSTSLRNESPISSQDLSLAHTTHSRMGKTQAISLSEQIPGQLRRKRQANMAQHPSKRRQESRRSMPLSACCLSLFFLVLSLKGCQAVLTTLAGTSYNGDSEYSDWQRIVDGKFLPIPYDGQICFTSNAAAQHSYISTVFPAPVLVRTIFFVNREPECNPRLLRTEFYVGFNSSPWLNTACGINPRKSGVYFCNQPNGLVGTYLSIYKNTTGLPGGDCSSLEGDSVLNFCEIRAYSYIPLGYDTTVSYTFTADPSVFICPTCQQDDPLKLYVAHHEYPLVTIPGYNENTIRSNGEYLSFEVSFSTDRHVHSVVLYGNCWDDFGESKDWSVSVGSIVYGQWDVEHKEGKEIIVNATGRSVKVYRINPDPKPWIYVYFSFRWIGIFSTSTNCGGAFAWTYSADQPGTYIAASFAYDTNIQYYAVISDCAVFHTATLSDDSVLPSWIQITNNGKSFKLTISPTIATGTYTIKQTAQLRDGVTTSKSDYKLLVITVANCFTTVISMDDQSNMTSIVTQATSTQTFGVAIDSASITLSASNVCGGFTYSITSFTFLTMNQSTNVLTLGSSNMAHIGSYTVTLSAELTNYPTTSAATKTFTVTLVDPCLTTNLLLGDILDMTSTVTQAAATQNFTAATDAASTSASATNLCGGFTYSITSYTFVSINQSTRVLTLGSSNMAHIGSYTVTLSAELINYPTTPAATKTFTAVLVDPCLTTDLTLGSQVIPTMTSQITSAATTHTFSAATNSASTLAGLTNLCGSYTYSITQSYSFVTINQTAHVLSLQSNNIAQIGSYSVTLSATLTSYPARTAITTSFTAVLTDPCTSTVLTLPTTLTNFSIAPFSGISYTQTFMPANDSRAVDANDHSICGPRVYSIAEATPAIITTITPPNDGQDYTSAWTLSQLSNSCADSGVWTMTLRVTLLNYPMIAEATKVFTVTVYHKCCATSINPQTLATSLTYQIVFNAVPTVLTSFMMNTDSAGVLEDNPMVCGAKKYSTGKPWLSAETPADPATQEFQLVITTNDYSLASTYTINLVVSFVEVNWTGTLTQTFTLTMLHPCKLTTITTSQTISPITYPFGGTAVLQAFTSFSDSIAIQYGLPGLCKLVYKLNLQAEATAYGVSVIPGTPNQIRVQTNVAGQKGKSISLTLSANSTPQQQVTQSQSVTFQVNIQDTCPDTTISFGSWLPTAMTAKVTQAAATQTFQASIDSLSTTTGITNLCGSFFYSFTQEYSFLTINQTTQVISLQSDNMAHVGSYTTNLAAFLINYPLASQASISFTVVLVNPCQTTTLTLPTSLQTFTITSFTRAGFNQTFMPATDSAATLAAIPLLCGPRVYEILEQQPKNFLKIVQTEGDPYTMAWTLEAMSNNLADAGIWTVTLQASLLSYLAIAPVSQVITSATVIDPCPMTQIQLGSLNNMSIFVLGSATTSTFTDATDSQSVSYGQTNVCGGFVYSISPTAFLSIDGYTRIITLSSTNMAAIGTYTATLTAKLTQYPAVLAATQQFTIALVDPCLETQIPQFTLPTMTVVLNQSSVTQSLDSFFINSVASSKSMPTLCGSFYTVTLSLNKPFLTYSAPMITGSNTDNTQLGIFSIEVTISLGNYSSTSATWIVISTCTMQAPVVQFQSVTIKIGKDPLPYSIPFTQPSPVQTCGQTASITSTPSSLVAGGFISLTPNLSSGGSIKVDSLTLAEAYTHTVTLTNVTPGLGTTFSTVLEVIIADACIDATFETIPNPIAPMFAVLASTAIVEQSFKIYTDLERQVPSSICPVTAQVVPALSFISVDNLNGKILVDTAILSQLIPASVTTHAFELQVKQQRCSTAVPPASYSFELHVTCVTTSIELVSSSLTDTTFEINPTATGPMLLLLPVYRCLPCFQSATYSRALVMDQVPQEPLSRFMTTSDAEGAIRITISDPQDTGQYSYRVIVKETNGPVEGPVNDQVTFKLTLTCTVNQFFNKVKSLSNIVYTIPSSLISPAETYAMPVYETNPVYCQLNDIKSTLVFENPSVIKADFIVIDNSVKPARLIVKENDPSKVGTYSFHIHAVEPTTGLVNETVMFKVTITCLIENFSPVLNQKIVKEITYAIRSAPAQFTLPSYSWKPKSCHKDVRFRLVIENKLDGKFPPFFKVNFQSLVVSLNGGRDHYEFANQEFQFRLIAETTDSQYMNSDYSFLIKTTFKNSPPKFLDPLETQKFFVGFKYEVLLPEITDEDGDEIKTISIAPKLSWIQLRRDPNRQSQLRIFADLTILTKEDVGNTDFKITLTDEFGGSSVIKQSVMVLYDANQITQTKSSTILVSSNSIKNATAKTNSAPESTNATAATNTTDASNKTDVQNATSASNASDDALNATDDGSNKTASANATSECPADNRTDSNSTDCATNETETEEALNSTASNETNSSEGEAKTGTENLTAASAFTPAAGNSSSEPNKKDEVMDAIVNIVKFDPVQVIVPNSATSFEPSFKVKPSWQKPKFNLTADVNAEPEVFTKLVEGRCAVTLLFSQDMDFSRIKDPGLVFDVMIVVYKDKGSRQLAGTDQAQTDKDFSPKNLTTIEIDEDVDTINFSWVLKSLGATEAEFEVEFLNPFAISVGNTLHVLQIKQKEGQKIFTTKGIPMINISIEDKLPAQITPGDQNITSNINAFAGSSSKIAMLGTLIVSIMAGQSLAMLFGMVGSLQYILYVSIINTNFPGNANDVFKKLLNIVTFDLVPDFIMTPWYELVSKKTNNQDISQQFNQRFDQMGYKTSNWVVNMGSNSLFIGIMLAQMIVLPLFRGFFFALRCQRKIRLKIKDIESTLYWNQPTRFLVELFFELTLICAIRFQTSEQDTKFERFFTYSALAVMLSLVVFAWYIAHILIHIRRDTEKKEVQAEYGTLYEGLDPTNRIGFMSTPFFCLCRLFNIIFLIFYQRYVTFQLIGISLVSFVQVWFSTGMPYKRKLTSIIELMNQICTYIITVFCFSLTDHVPHAHMRYKFGWAIIGIVGFFIIINILVQTYDIVLNLIEAVRQIYFKYRRVPGPNTELIPKPAASQQQNGQTHPEAEEPNSTQLVTRTQTEQPVIQKTNLKPINQLVIDDENAINNETSQVEELDRDKGFMLDIHFDQPSLLKPKPSLLLLNRNQNRQNMRVKSDSVLADDESLSVLDVAVLPLRSKKHSIQYLYQDLDDLEEQKVIRNPDYEDDEQQNEVDQWPINNIDMSKLSESDIIRRYNYERQQDKNLKTERKAALSLRTIREEDSDDM